MRKKVERDEEGESDGPLDKPNLLSLQNTAIKVRGCQFCFTYGALIKVDENYFWSEMTSYN